MFIFLFGVLLLKLKIIDDDKGKEEEAGVMVMMIDQDLRKF